MRIIQLETAVGAAMKNFEGAHGKKQASTAKIEIVILPIHYHTFLLMSVIRICW